MAVPRPVLLALLGVALCAAALLATRGAHDPGGSVTAVPAPAPSAPKQHPTHAQQRKPIGHSRQLQPKHSAPKHTAAPTRPAGPSAAGTLAAVTSGGDAIAAPTTSKPTAPQPAPKPKLSLAERVKAALAHDKVVVFLFTQPGAADDTGTRQSVGRLQGMKRVMVVKAGFKDLTEFRPVLAGANVSQIPSVVIVHKGGPGRLIEGYVDAGTLRQNVADALR